MPVGVVFNWQCLQAQRFPQLDVGSLQHTGAGLVLGLQQLFGRLSLCMPFVRAAAIE